MGVINHNIKVVGNLNGLNPAPYLYILKTGKARAVRFSTLERICKELDCQPGDILEFRPDVS
jgi:putative transcriptional regulator